MCVPPYSPWLDCLYVMRAGYGWGGTGPLSIASCFIVVIVPLARAGLVEKKRIGGRREGGAGGMVGRTGLVGFGVRARKV